MPPPPLTRTHFEAALTPGLLRTMAIMQTALVFGPLLYVIPVFVVFSGRSVIPPGPDEFLLVNILSLLHGAALLTAGSVGSFFFQRMFSSDRLMAIPDANPETLASMAAGMLRSAMILRLALFEGAAFFGITVCILAMINGVLDAEPAYWLNLASLAIFAAFGILTFPTKERLMIWFEEMLARSR
jgi:hypothetical protein